MTDATQIVCTECDAINRVPTARLGDGPRCGVCKFPLFSGKPVALDEARFRRHLKLSGIPLLVDFWASWCGPCRTMAPEFATAATLLEPGMRLVKLSTEEAPAVAQEYRISSIPTLALFVGGVERARQSGVIPARQIADWARRAM